MVSTDTVFKTFMIGGTVMITDGFDAQELAQIIATEKLGRLTLMPGMIAPIIDAVRSNGSKVKGIKWIGAMADLVPLEQIADVTALLNAPYLNTFGATETGLAPATAGVIEIGEIANGGSVEVISNDIEPDIKCWIHYDGKALALGSVKLNKFYPSRVFNIENSIFRVAYYAIQSSKSTYLFC